MHIGLWSVTITAGHPAVGGDQGTIPSKPAAAVRHRMDSTAWHPNNAFVRAIFALDSTLHRFLGTSTYQYRIGSGWVFGDGAGADCGGVDQKFFFGVL